MAVKSCPESETLKLLLTGEIFGAEAESLEQHLLECDQCLLAAHNIPANDELVAAIRARREFVEETGLLEQAIEQAKQFRAEAETMEPIDTQAIGRGVEASGKAPSLPKQFHLDADIDFLAPPQQADEIGRIGDYRLLDVLGVGGMGIVFRAEDTKLRRQVALKAMKPAAAASRSAKDRFVREAQATAAIDHDNIVHIYQVGEDRNVPFIAMQFLRGESLQKRLQRDGRLDPRHVVRIGCEVAAGLAAAHHRGLIHRDIKPDNIWLDAAAAHRAKILDFGLVRTASDDAELTQSGMVLGTPRYMAPEQAKGEAVDHRCDLFSLGSVLYHLASGQPPFDGGSLAATLLAVSQADCRPIAAVCPDLHPELAGLISRLMSKDRNTRPQTAAEVADTLARIEKQLDGRRSQSTGKTIQRQLTETTELNQPPSAEPVGAGDSAARRRAPWRVSTLIGGAATGIALAVFAGLYFAGVIFKVETKDGTLAVKVVGDNIATSVEGQKVTIKNRETDETYTIVLDSGEKSASLKPGSYFILETDSGLRTPTDHFTIRSGKTQVVEVTWQPKTVKDPAGVLSNDADRRAAEWVLSIGGKARVHGAAGEIRSKMALPQKPIALDMVWLRDIPLATDAGLAVFADCKRLSELTNLDLRGTPVTDAGLAHFKDCRNLRVLDIPYTQVGDEGLANFRECKLLTSLWLHRTLVTDAGLANFKGCRNLAQLSLLDTEVSSDGLANFKESRNLIQMYLGGTRIDDAGLAHIKGCTSFRKIDLNGTRVSDAGIAMLQNCKNLETLKVNQTNVTAEGIARFRKALPNCKVEWQQTADLPAP